jgi:hypothetical protein
VASLAFAQRRNPSGIKPTCLGSGCIGKPPNLHNKRYNQR